MIKVIVIVFLVINFIYMLFMMPLLKMASKVDLNIEQNNAKNNKFPSESNRF